MLKRPLNCIHSVWNKKKSIKCTQRIAQNSQQLWKQEEGTKQHSTNKAERQLSYLDKD